ncbi:hypothetical protein DPEC_G00126210 [Dallia pectoralis]|uniref:Uncharacterized protein n=2 Tax=Dallia pectoralis TaxID=75939 RepID=A0ACC2GS27_DALPE|nr:hypothetical protein DPEC_G00126180 [Dallia pectoralis]KAJ8006236.1 hypothetical protein DPEC_G00126210 [Dallia pectoralis]
MVLLIDQLLQELMGEKGRDLMGIPLLNRAKMEHIWTTQKKHVKCIQDVPGVLLYTETGSCTKEGFQLTTYRLAECLVELRHQTSMTIHSQQPINIVGLWQDLLDYDKQRVVFAARHQEKLTNGRFRHKNKVEFTPDVVSLKWRVLASTGSPAQWIDCCRLVEAMFIRLWNIHKNPKKQGNTTMSRWTLNLQDYRKIRQLVVGNEQGWTGYREYRAFSRWANGDILSFFAAAPSGRTELEVACERTFSTLKFIKSRLQSSLSGNRLEMLMLMATEKDILMSLGSDMVIDRVAEKSDLLRKLLL